MSEPATQKRLHDLGNTIWGRVKKIEAYLLAEHEARATFGRHHGSEYQDFRREEEVRLWGDLQTLFRGGVFPDDPALVASLEEFNKEAEAPTLPTP